MLGCVCLALFVSPAQSEQRSLLLVAGSNYEMGAISQSELRKVFLGIPVTKNGIRLRGLFNASDPYAASVFLQQVVFMSEREYERQLASRVFRQGGSRPKEHDNLDALAHDVRNTPGAVTFMWSDEFASYEGLESLTVIWTGVAQ